jgi:hypothetical protein
MKEEWKREVRSLFTSSKGDTEDQIAQEIAETFRRKYPGAWQCIIGRAFGSSVTYDEGTHWVEQFGPLWVEIWRCA